MLLGVPGSLARDRLRRPAAVAVLQLLLNRRINPQPKKPLNPIPYLKGFAWLSIVALSCSIFSDFWLPMLIGAVVITVLVKLATPSRS